MKEPPRPDAQRGSRGRLPATLWCKLKTSRETLLRRWHQEQAETSVVVGEVLPLPLRRPSWRAARG